MKNRTERSEKGKNAITEYFKQTFRRHGGGEYSELLTRGLHGGERGLNKKYPWAYVRLFALIFVLFAVFLLIIRFTSNEIFVPTVTLLGAVCFNLAFLLLLYELYPKKDLSFMVVLLALLIGGAGSNVFSQILFSIFKPSNAWLHAVYSGFFEELSKAAAVAFVLLTARKETPLAGFILGAAVGCGFSITEDMGYIFLQANEMPYVNLTTIIEISLARGVSAVCTHTLWTAAIGWALSRFKRHRANLAVYGVTLLSCGLHILWDLPLSNLALGFIYASCASVALIECTLIIHFQRKKAFSSERPKDLYKNEEAVNELWQEAEQEQLARESLEKTDPKYWRYWGHFTLALAAFLMAVISVLYCSLPFRETYGAQSFRDSDSFVAFMQNGVEFEYDENRGYDPNAESVPSGEYVIQLVTGGDGYTYGYMYLPRYDDVLETFYYFPYSISVYIDGVAHAKEDVYDDGLLYASFFRLRTDVTGFYFEPTRDEITVILYNPAFERDLSDWKYLSLFCAFSAITGGALIIYAALVIKSWKVKKLCTTNNVSSAE